MQPPQRIGPPGATGPPPPSGPNMFRRTRPHKHTAAATAAMQPATQPMTDPFAFVRAPSPMAPGGLPLLPSSNPPPMQAPPNTMYSQAGGGLPPQPQTFEDVPAAASGPRTSSGPGVTLFNPHISAPSVGFPVPNPAGYAASHTEHGYFNSKEQPPSTAAEPPRVSSAPPLSQPQMNQGFIGQPCPRPGPPQTVPPSTTSSSQWAPDHVSRPPSVQNYFQPTSDPPPQQLQPYSVPPQPQVYPPHASSPHHNTTTPPSQPVNPHMQMPLPPPNLPMVPSPQWPDPNASFQQNSHLQTQNYFSQSSTAHESWFSQPPQDSGYHQMGTGPDHSQPQTDSGDLQPAPCDEQGACAAPAFVPYSQDSGTLSMFFKDDVENEETLAGDRNKAVNGIPRPFQHHNNPQAHSFHTDGPLDYHSASHQEHSYVPYMNDGTHGPPLNIQKPPDSHYDHVENLECVPNQEVLPSETLGSPAAPAVQEVDQFETGPNLETPDSAPRPIRSASVSSNYSNMSHGSGTGARRHQGVVGTFIQQESPRLTDDPNLSAATGGYFEQIDTSPDTGARQSTSEQMWHPTPSPPKPTGVFQASANSSFEPVRSHGVGVRPAEVDVAKIVAEGGADSTPGNLEQPPDNLENIYSGGQPLPPMIGGGVPHPTRPVVHSHSRPSSRAFGASRPCESPATTLWAQNDPTSLGANILLAPAAPVVLVPLREPSVDVIQPPEDSPLDLQPSKRVQPSLQQPSENLENPPKVSDAESADSQGNMGYASLLVSESLHQSVLIAPPVSNYSVISPTVPSQTANQSSPSETAPPVKSLAQGQGASSSQSPPASNLNPLFASGPISFNSPVPNQGPLNLTRDNTEASTPEITCPPQPHSTGPPLSGGQSENHSSLPVNSQASLAASVCNHKPPSNYELLDFSMHQSQNPAPGHPSSLHESPQSSNGFYLQVTKDGQQGARSNTNAPVQTPDPSSNPQLAPTTSQSASNTAPPPNEPPKTSQPKMLHHGQGDGPPVPVSGGQPAHSRYPALPAAGPPLSAAGDCPPVPYPPGPRGPVPPGAPQPAPADPPRPPSTAGSQQGYAPPQPPMPGHIYGGYYGYYGEYPDGRAPYPPGQYPPPTGDPRAPQYYQVSP